MPRKPRLQYPGALFHVIARGNNQQQLFAADDDYRLFLNRLSDLKTKRPFHLYAYCLMPNHVHLLVEVQNVPLSVIMQRLLTGYTVNFNFKYKKHGHLFQGRYKAILCQKDSYLLELVRYIHLNPVRAGLVAEPLAWPWSGHAQYVRRSGGKPVDDDLVLACFDKDKIRARRKYAEFILEGAGMGHRAEMYPPEKTPYLGEREFLQDSVCRHSDSIEKATPGATKAVAPLSEILGRASRTTGLPAGIIQGRGRSIAVAKARRQFILLAHEAGHRAADVARFLHRSQAYISRFIDRRYG